MRSMIPALTLALCLTVTGQGSSSVPPPADSARQGQAAPGSGQEVKANSSAATPAGAAQQKKHGHATPPEHSNTPQPAASGEDKTPSTTEVTPRLLDRWFQAYVLITGLLVLIGLSGLGVVRRQLREMKEARKQTDSLIKRAIEQSSALSDAAEQTDRLIEQAIQQANTAAEQAKAANMAACAAKSSSENFAQIAASSVQSVHVAQEAMRLEQRAWVFVTETRVGELQAGKPLSIIIGFKNTGRTPARNVQIATCIDALPQGQVPEPNLEKTQSRGIIPPNGTLFVTVGAGRKNAEGVTEKGLQAILAGELVVWVYGTTTYEDIFETRQATMFCYMLQPDGKTFGAADMYNDAT
ncbi:MAG TPA: hypothetical protein VI685_00065 [Candidatus Angelobacter sp.]